MKRDRWIEALLKLKRNHLQEIQLFYADETYILTELNRTCQVELTQFNRPLERARSIRKHTDGIKQLQRDRALRYQALKKRHSEEVYNLLQLKLTIAN